MSSFSLSKLIAGGMSSTSMVLHTLKFEASPTDDKMISVQRVDPDGTMVPIMHYHTNTESDPTVKLYRVSTGNSNIQPLLIGEATCHFISSKVDLRANSYSVEMRKSQMTGGYKFQYPPAGNVRWESGKLAGHKLLDDNTGSQIARYRAKGLGQDEVLEINVPVEDPFLDVIVLSLVTRLALQALHAQVGGDVGGEVLQALAGT